MQIIRYKPYTNGIRHFVNIRKNLLSKVNTIFKQSILGFKRFKGRGSDTGRITVRHLGGGCKKKYRILNFLDSPKCSLIVSVMYDPFRSSFISLNFDFKKNLFFRNLATNQVGPGSLQMCNRDFVDLKLGNRTLIKNVPIGSLLHSLSLNNQVKYVRAAGLFFQIIQKSQDFCKVRLPSGLIKNVPNTALGTFGLVSNTKHAFVSIGKAGRNRLLGFRPSVRGIAMNPVDHPHGGRTNGGRPSVTPWGIPTKGKPTVKQNK